MLWLAAQITAGTFQGTVVALVSYMTSALLAIGYVANLWKRRTKNELRLKRAQSRRAS